MRAWEAAAEACVGRQGDLIRAARAAGVIRGMLLYRNILGQVCSGVFRCAFALTAVYLRRQSGEQFQEVAQHLHV